MLNRRFFAALIIALASFVRSYTGIDVGIDDATANQLVNFLMLAVFMLPHKQTDADK